MRKDCMTVKRLVEVRLQILFPLRGHDCHFFLFPPTSTRSWRVSDAISRIAPDYRTHFRELTIGVYFEELSSQDSRYGSTCRSVFLHAARHAPPAKIPLSIHSCGCEKTWLSSISVHVPFERPPPVISTTSASPSAVSIICLATTKSVNSDLRNEKLANNRVPIYRPLQYHHFPPGSKPISNNSGMCGAAGRKL